MLVKLCDKCGIKIEENKKYNLVKNNLNEPTPPGMAIGYQVQPMLDGIIFTSVSGNGRKLHLCDKCIGELLDLLNIEKKEEE